MAVPHVCLVDTPQGPGRTTATLVAALAARLASLHLISGADAVGSLAAGFSALGREVTKTDQGARLRSAIEKGRAGSNGVALWSGLLLGQWISPSIPSPVLEHLRNDVALLLCDDLEQILEMMPIPGQPNAEHTSEPCTSSFADLVLGMWAFSSEVVRAVEALAAPMLSHPDAIIPGSNVPDFTPPVLR